MDWFSKSSYDALRKLLDEERKHLFSGDFDALFALSNRKEALLKKVQSEKQSIEKVEDLASRARRNQDLMAAAMNGIRSATRVLENVSKPASFSTYGEYGQQSTLSGATTRKLEQKS